MSTVLEQTRMGNGSWEVVYNVLWKRLKRFGVQSQEVYVSCLSGWLAVCLPACLPACLSVCLAVCPSVHLSDILAENG